MAFADWLANFFKSAPQGATVDRGEGLFPLAESWTGKSVTEIGALNASVVYACARAISDAMASLPLIVYEIDGNGVKRRAVNHPTYSMLKEQANPWMTSFEYRSAKFVHLNLWGNHYAEKQFDGKGNVIGLFPIRPDRATLHLEEGELFYLVMVPNGATVRLPAWRIHHVKGLSTDGFLGLSPIRLAANSLGLSLAAEEYGARWFGSGGKPTGILRHPGQLTAEAYDRLKSGWVDASSLSESQKTRILEEGMEYESVSLPPEDSQFLQTRQFQIGELARWFRVPPAVIGDMTGATYSNNEQQQAAFVESCLRAWASNDEQALRRDVLVGVDRERFDIEYDFSDLLRGDTQTRFEAYRTAVNNGLMSPNEVRRKENLAPTEGGDHYYMPLQVGKISADGNLAAPVTVDAARGQMIEGEYRVIPENTRLLAANHEVRSVRAVGARRRLADQQIEALAEVIERTGRKQGRDIRKQLDLLRGDPEQFFGWLRGYSGELSPFVLRSLIPVFRAFMLALVEVAAAELDKESVGLTDALAEWVRGYAERFAGEYSDSTYNQLRALFEAAIAEGTEAVEAVEGRLVEWDEKRAEKEARQESHNFGNAATVAVWQGYRVEKMRWRANAGACPICRRMDGKVVAINEAFLRSGDTVEGDEGQEPLTVTKNLRHPPLHGACTCGVSAE